MKMRNRTLVSFAIAAVLCAVLAGTSVAQTDCAEGNGVLDNAPLKGTTPEQLIQKVAANESKLKQLHSHYTYTEDLMVQTLTGTSVDGQMHQVTDVSFDDKGKRVEKVTFAEQSTLRGVQLTAEDFEDIRTFMPWFLTTDEVPQYTLTYAGQQHVDDLDTFVFHVVPRQEEKNHRYFQGRVWIDHDDLTVVKLCGKSVPEIVVKKKKKGPVEVRPTFVTYRQLIDGNWFPVYSRIDDTLQFGVQSVHVREVVKSLNYKRTGAVPAAKP